MHHTKTTETLLFSILFLFFLQSLSDFIEAIYAFGLLVTAFTVEVTAIVLLFTPLLLLFFRKEPSRVFILTVAYIAIAARLFEPMLNPEWKLVASGIAVGAFMLLFPSLLYKKSQIRGWQIASGLAIAVSLSIFFRTANSGLDLSESRSFQIISWVLAIIAGVLIWQGNLTTPQDMSSTRAASGGRITGLSIGLASVILMIYFAFASPTVIARWTGFSYPLIVTTLAVVLVVFAVLLSSERFTGWLTQRIILAWNLLFVAMLVLTILPHQIAFPTSPESYPIDAQGASSLAMVFLLLMLLLSPILFINFMLFVRGIASQRPSLHQLGKSFALAALFFLIMVFFHVFTTIYDYAPVIGPLFRDRFWFVYLLAGLGMGLPLLLLSKETFSVGKPEVSRPFVPVMLGALAILTMGALFITAPKPVTSGDTSQLRVMTYNIQQGFDEEGNKNLEGQLALIREVDPDILGLQESDTARVANGNADAVRYLADNLDMYSYYGPTATTGTFGIALLSKYPIQSPKTFFMYSTGEQTATIQAEIVVNGKTYNIFVTHLGNGGPIFQLEDMLTRVDGLDNVIAMGDFNFRPPTEQYALMTQTLSDSWLLKWPGGKDIPGMSSEKRIDHIFVSLGSVILKSEFGVSPASDHPYIYSVIQP